MPSRIRLAQEITALALAALGTLVLSIDTEVDAPCPGTASEEASAAALAGLLDAELAAREAMLLLDQPIDSVTLGFASEHERLVWRARSHDRTVLLDARTGEALAFEFG
jgi:hypothetical protein